jgi:hypothetical protein
VNLDLFVDELNSMTLIKLWILMLLHLFSWIDLWRSCNIM